MRCLISWNPKDYKKTSSEKKNTEKLPERTPRRERSHQMTKEFDEREDLGISQFDEYDYESSGLISERQWERLRRATLRGVGLDIA